MGSNPSAHCCNTAALTTEPSVTSIDGDNCSEFNLSEFCVTNYDCTKYPGYPHCREYIIHPDFHLKFDLCHQPLQPVTLTDVKKYNILPASRQISTESEYSRKKNKR